MKDRQHSGRLSKDRQYSGLMKETIEWSKESDNTLAKWKTDNTVAEGDNRVVKRRRHYIGQMKDRQHSGRLSKDRQYSGLMKETIEWLKESDNTLAKWKTDNTVAVYRRTDNIVVLWRRQESDQKKATIHWPNERQTTQWSFIEGQTLLWSYEGDNRVAKTGRQYIGQMKEIQHSGQQKNRQHGGKMDRQCSSKRDRKYSGQTNKDKQWTKLNVKWATRIPHKQGWALVYKMLLCHTRLTQILTK